MPETIPHMDPGLERGLGKKIKIDTANIKAAEIDSLKKKVDTTLSDDAEANSWDEAGAEVDRVQAEAAKNQVLKDTLSAFGEHAADRAQQWKKEDQVRLAAARAKMEEASVDAQVNQITDELDKINSQPV
jgi:hypothetical protein